MTEFELLSLAAEITQSLQTEETTFLTVLFGYLLASNLLGAKLATLQLGIFNTIYIVMMIGLINNMRIFWSGINNYNSQVGDIRGYSPPETFTIGSIYTELALLVYISLFLGSLYFMWSVRSNIKKSG
ncbi:MAG: hypothetical protein AB8B95_11470 [Pseudohongiellaceae bacterium]